MLHRPGAYKVSEHGNDATICTVEIDEHRRISVTFPNGFTAEFAPKDLFESKGNDPRRSGVDDAGIFELAIASSLHPIRTMLAGHLEIRPDSDPVVFLIDPADEQGRAVWMCLRSEVPGYWVGPRGGDEDRILIAVVDFREVIQWIPLDLRAWAGRVGDGTRIILIANGGTTGGFVRLEDITPRGDAG
jgi:hypothetical protein